MDGWLLVTTVLGSATVAPVTATVLAAVSHQHAGLASGVDNAVARTAQLLCVAGAVIAWTSIRADVLQRRDVEDAPEVRQHVTCGVAAPPARPTSVVAAAER